jgi:hypothetical protein
MSGRPAVRQRPPPRLIELLEVRRHPIRSGIAAASHADRPLNPRLDTRPHLPQLRVRPEHRHHRQPVELVDRPQRHERPLQLRIRPSRHNRRFATSHPSASPGSTNPARAAAKPLEPPQLAVTTLPIQLRRLRLPRHPLPRHRHRAHAPRTCTRRQQPSPPVAHRAHRPDQQPRPRPTRPTLHTPTATPTANEPARRHLATHRRPLHHTTSRRRQPRKPIVPDCPATASPPQPAT